MKHFVASVFCIVVLLTPATAQTYSTGAVSNYVAAGCGGPDLPLSVGVAAGFRFWYNLAGLHLVTAWNNGDVWGSDFRDGTDMDPSGGSELPQVYFYNGHGICENPPAPGSGDFIFTCGNFGTPNLTRIGSSSRWGNAGGHLQFAFIDASCPMDLPELGTEWFPPFQGLHMAVGHSGDVNHDTLNSSTRGSQFAAYTVGCPGLVEAFCLSFPRLFPALPVGDAWMSEGLIDVQPGVCAVAIAAGNDRNDAINRRENETVKSNLSNPTPNWFAWKWICS
jgi:hypothetical protein